MTRAIPGRAERWLANSFTAIDDAAVADDPRAHPLAHDLGKVLGAAAPRQGNNGYDAFRAGTGAAASVARPAVRTDPALSP